jgi:DNA processing protein
MAFEGVRTIAAVATGLDVTFPPENRDLDMQIRRRGAVISAYPPGTGPARERFLARNEIVAAMALVTVVVRHPAVRSVPRLEAAWRSPPKRHHSDIVGTYAAPVWRMAT